MRYDFMNVAVVLVADYLVRCYQLQVVCCCSEHDACSHKMATNLFAVAATDLVYCIWSADNAISEHDSNRWPACWDLHWSGWIWTTGWMDAECGTSVPDILWDSGRLGCHQCDSRRASVCGWSNQPSAKIKLRVHGSVADKYLDCGT